MGQLIQTMLESGVKLGVSSRGSGEVDGSGNVQGFEIITVDVVAQPSAPGAYPTPVYEHLMNNTGDRNRSALFQGYGDKPGVNTFKIGNMNSRVQHSNPPPENLYFGVDGWYQGPPTGTRGDVKISYTRVN
jgi:hypothetical protein